MLSCALEKRGLQNLYVSPDILSLDSINKQNSKSILRVGKCVVKAFLKGSTEALLDIWSVIKPGHYFCLFCWHGVMWWVRRVTCSSEKSCQLSRIFCRRSQRSSVHLQMAAHRSPRFWLNIGVSGESTNIKVTKVVALQSNLWLFGICSPLDIWLKRQLGQKCQFLPSFHYTSVSTNKKCCRAQI